MKTKIYTTYAQDSNMTFILEDTFDKIDNDDILISTELIGFYYGEPNKEDTFYYQRSNLKVEF